MRKNLWLTVVFLCACSGSSWAIYGPALARTDTATAVRACDEGQFPNGPDIDAALASQDPAKIVPALTSALQQFHVTHITADLYAARAFCIHELVPAQLPRDGEIASPQAREPTALVKQFKDLGIEYFYYGPDAVWTLEKNPADLNALASAYLESPWGRMAFLMMTRMGWSQGDCREGSDQFRQVINHGEQFLVDNPDTEVSASIRLELGHAYATWWNVSRSDRDPPYVYPEMYKVGAGEAKQRAIELYQEYLKTQKKGDPEVEKLLKALQTDPKGSGELDYFCADYED